MGKMQRLPVPWHHTWRAAEALGLAKPKSTAARHLVWCGWASERVEASRDVVWVYVHRHSAELVHSERLA